MGRRKTQDNLKTETSSVDRADPNVKGTLKTEQKRKRLEISENAPESRKMPKRLASGTICKDNTFCLSYERRIVKTKKLHVVDEELDAVKLTNFGRGDTRENRKLTQFIFHDDDGKPQPVEMLEMKQIYVSGLILPLEEIVDKSKETKVLCGGFGPIESWAISEFEKGKPIIWISTETADYECLKPASAYKKFYDSFYDKARACTLIYRNLSKTAYGNPNLRLNELLTRVACAMSGKFSQGVPIEGLILSWGEFIHNQLIGLDETSSEDDTVFSKLPVLLALRDASKRNADFVSAKVMSFQEVPYSKKSDQLGAPAKANVEDENLKLARLMGEIETWQSFQKRKSRRSVTSSQRLYINTNEHEIEKDHPPPAYYKAEIKETDEFLLFGSQCHAASTDQLPHRMLHNWSLYSTDSSFISLELLPMKSCGDNDAIVYGSGIMTDEDGSGFSLDADSNPSSSSGFLNKYGTPLSLSAIKEWFIEFESSRVSISIRTNMAWYKLGKPSQRYAPWFEPVLKAAMLAISITTLLKEQRRVSRLSFQEVIKKVSEFGKDNPTHISFDREAVETYVVVHGHIILQLFSKFPDDAIRKCAFVRTLQDRMKERHYTKRLVKKKVVLNKKVNMNSRAIEYPTISNSNKFSATTTRLIKRIWRRGISGYLSEDSKEDYVLEVKEKNVKEELKENEDDKSEETEEQKIVSNKKVRKFHSASKEKKFCWPNMEIRWNGDAVGETSTGEALHKQAIVNGDVVTVGGAVIMETTDMEQKPAMYIVEYMFEDSDARKMVHGRQLLRGFQTILGNFANKREVFLTNVCEEFELANVVETVNVEIQQQPRGYQHHEDNLQSDSYNRERRSPFDYFSKNLYWPEKGGVFCLQTDSVGLGNGYCYSCKLRESQNIKVFKLSTSMNSFTYQGVKYHIHDFLYLNPHPFAADKGNKGTLRSGRNVGLKPYIVCQLLDVEVPKPLEEADPESVIIRVRRFFRPEDISAEKAYNSDIREVYYSKQVITVPVVSVRGKCEVRKKQDLQSADSPYIFEHIFFCRHQYTENGALKQLPPKIKFSTPRESPAKKATSRKMREMCEDRENESDNRKSEKFAASRNFLTALDLFAGCGGLSEGLQKSGASVTKWAIEFEEPAGKAFQLNHPEASALINNCNVILRAVMSACGNADDCISTPETVALAAKIDGKEIDKLPRPGQVDFIYGGPPCQGFSKMNRFSQSPWSTAQSELILNFLSYVDVFRPKFVLLENVRNFISFNKGQMFRFTLASLIEMGYQVRFGILEAGAYGVSQSRKRAFIWAASPGETLPEWPEPMHVFAGPELKVTLDKNIQYAAVRSTATGAPFRAITVRDTIGDLPEVANGASASTMEYKSQPISWFQKRVRGDMEVLTDHISKEMSELNLTRCQGIPRCPGADWRKLPNKRIRLSNGRAVDLVPRCVRNTAQRHNQWKGVFGRLDWEGHFPTTVTDPHPMHKVGMCFHPEQDRIVTVRECARSQGFPDSYKFAGNVQHKHKQIGNAVPPPLAFALGRKLKEALDGKSSNQ